MKRVTVRLKKKGRRYLYLIVFDQKTLRYVAFSFFTNSINKYGWDNFEHIILFKDLTKEEADILEDLCIRIYNTIDRNFGYNFRYGGSHGEHSEESKKKMSDSLKKLYNEGFTHPMQGKHHSEEAKKKLFGWR